jgi:ketopantoate reductase
MNALVVGAGSVGQVLARHLHLGGSKVSFFVKGKHAQRISNGLVLYHLNKRDARMRPIHFRSFEVMTKYSQLDRQSWDQIYICVPSNGLSDTMFEGIKQYRGSATIIKIQPGLGDRNSFTSHFEESVLVVGMITFVSYRAPLSGENIAEPGMAYWFPPFLSTLFSGAEDRVQEVVDALDGGGLPVKVHRDVESLVGYVLAVQAPLMAGLECAGWSIRQFTRNQRSLGCCCKVPAIRSTGDHESLQPFLGSISNIALAETETISPGIVSRLPLHEVTKTITTTHR